MNRHMRQSCKIANSEEGMEKLMDHTLQRQLVDQQKQLAGQQKQLAEQSAQLAKLTALLESQLAIVPRGQPPQPGTVTHLGGQAHTIHNTVGHSTHIEKIEIRPWDGTRAVAVSVAEIVAAFAENARLQEYVRLPEHSLTDPDIAPPYVTELFTDLIRRGHSDPTTRNIYLNPKRADQVLVHLKEGRWEVKAIQEGIRALLDGVAISIHEVTLTDEKRRQLPMEAQNALAMAGLLYDDEPDEYVKRAKAPMTAHLTNLVPTSPESGSERRANWDQK